MKQFGASKFAKFINGFFFAPTSALPLAVLRIAVSLVLLYQASVLVPFAFDLFGKNAIIQGPLAEYLSNPYVWTLAGIAKPLTVIGLGESQIIWIAGVTYLVSLVALAVGLKTRISAFVVWFLHLTLMNSAPATNYGADQFLHISLFYLMMSPCGAALSVDSRGRTNGSLSSGAGFWIRIIQLHLCIAYFASGIEKAVGVQWWNGEVIWRSLNLPVYAQFDMSWLASHPWLLRMAAWGTLVIEIGYPVFIWPRATRWVWIGLVSSLHIGIAVFLGLGVFGMIMLSLTVCAFGLPALLASRTTCATGIGEEIRLRPNYA